MTPLHYLTLITLNVASSALPRISTAPDASGVQRFTSAGVGVISPRGGDYIRLNGSDAVAPVYHATFSPLFFNASDIDAALQRMARDGYDFTRVFIDAGTSARCDGINGCGGVQPLDAAYVANVVTYLKLAAAAGVYTMITLNGLPSNAFFANATGAAPTWCEYPHCDMFAPSFVAAWVTYATLLAEQLVSALKGDSTPIFGYSFVNEGFYLDNTLPFSSSSLIITTADGGTYDMSNATSRQQCADANAVHWASAVTGGIRAFDPNAMTTVGMFTFQAVGKTGPNGILPSGSDPRHPFRPSVITRFADVSYVDVHVYPVSPTWTLAADLGTEEWPLVDVTRMPVFMAEFGAFKFMYSNASAAASALVALQGASCAYNFSGWAVWTYDTWEQADILWTMVDDNNAIGSALAPVNRPNPCA